MAGHLDRGTDPESHAAAPADQEARRQRARRLLDQGDYGAAEALYRHLLADGCSSPGVVINLATLCQLRGALHEANELLGRALELDPGAPLAWFNRGVVLTLLGEREAAVASYRRCLELQPGQARAAFHLGLLLHGQGELAAAEQALRTALALNPNDPETHSNLAAVLLERGHHPEAIACCRAALAIQPDHGGALSNLGAALLEQGATAAAIDACRQAIRLQPQATEARNTLANALLEQGEGEAAIELFQQTLALRPDFAECHHNLGNAHLQGRDPGRAIGCYEAALRLRPAYAEAGWNLALSVLLSGDYGRGWELFDSPICLNSLPVRRPHASPACPAWEGESLPASGPLLLVSEQGLGDTLQFVRYVPLLAARGLAVTLCTEEKLHGLLQASGIGVPLLSPTEGNAVSEGHWLRLLSLPRRLGVTPGNPLPWGPYLRSSDALIEHWRRILAPERRPIIGVHWQGNPAVEVGGLRGRSLALEELAPIAATGIGSLLSLQRGSGCEQLEGCSFRHRFVAAQGQVDAVWDFLNMAALIAQCDLVITTDSAIAHLAGASGRPTWLLLHHQAEWRWGLAGADTFWYPTMRLFRQSTPGDWSGVIALVAAELPVWARAADLPQPPALPPMAGPSDTAVDPEPAAPASASAPGGDALQAGAGWGGGYFTGLTYGCYCFGELAPNWLDFALLSQRQRPARSGGEGSPFRYLELGSGMGLGLCLLAAAYPEGSFIGIDFHPSHIAHSQWLAAELELDNVSFHEADFLELAAADARLPFDPGSGFHYTVAHGILSWIGPEVRAALLQLAGGLLRPGGCFYCSYNTFPGWLDRTAFKALADLERQRLGAANLPLALQRAGSSLERLLRSDTPLRQALPQLAAQLKQINKNKRPDYLCGEFGAEHWQPFYVGQVHQLAAAHKLSYAASASLPDNFPSLLPAPLAEQLVAEADPTIRQALQDLAIHQSFRRDLFVKGPLPLSRSAQEQQLAQLQLRATVAGGGAADQPLRIDTNLGVMGDDAGRLRQLEALLAERPASLAELHQALAIPPEELVPLTSLLLHAGRVGLDRGAAGGAARASCRAVNARLIALMQGGHNLGHLAAPAIGHGAQPFSLIDGFVLDGLRQGLEGEVLSGCVLLGLQATGVELRDREGALLREPAACLELLDTHIAAFRRSTLPRLVQLGIVDSLG